MTNKWDLRFLKLAEFWAKECSKDPSTQVGAVIARGKKTISLGYNGFPENVEDTKEWLENRELKYKIVLHAEENAFILAERPVRGCTIYTWPFMPCSNCASRIIQHGIIRVVAPINNEPRWIESFKLTQTLFEKSGVILDLIDYPIK